MVERERGGEGETGGEGEGDREGDRETERGLKSALPSHNIVVDFLPKMVTAQGWRESASASHSVCLVKLKRFRGGAYTWEASS